MDNLSDENLSIIWGLYVRQQSYNVAEAYTSMNSQSYKVFEKDPRLYVALKNYVYDFADSEKILESLPPQKRDETRKNLEDFKNEMMLSTQKTISKQQLYKDYFSNYYQKRNTVSKASNFPWRAFTDEDVETISKRLNKDQ